MITVRRSIWDEPRPADAPPIGRLDWLLVGVFAAAAVIEGIVRPDLAWRPLVMVLALALLPALLWRRSRPLLAALVGWGVAGLLSVLQLTADAGDLGLLSMMAVLILLYSLVRWGSGREMVMGTAFVTVVVVLGMYASSAGWAEVLGASALLLMIVALAAVFRYRADLWQRQQREIRNRGAGGAGARAARHRRPPRLGHRDPGAGRWRGRRHPARAAAEALAAIEAEASRTLAEMRTIVRVLRDATAAAPTHRSWASPTCQLWRAPTRRPRVEVIARTVRRPGCHHPWTPRSTGSRRSRVTNAGRHARHATRVAIDVAGDGDAVRLRVSDDGSPSRASARSPGSACVGMAERAAAARRHLPRRARPRAAAGWSRPCCPGRGAAHEHPRRSSPTTRTSCAPGWR